VCTPLCSGIELAIVVIGVHDRLCVDLIGFTHHSAYQLIECHSININIIIIITVFIIIVFDNGARAVTEFDPDGCCDYVLGSRMPSNIWCTEKRSNSLTGIG
jgi:hypothetical protein